MDLKIEAPVKILRTIFFHYFIELWTSSKNEDVTKMLQFFEFSMPDIQSSTKWRKHNCAQF